MYGLHKVHKGSILLSTILSMVVSVIHELPQWLDVLIHLVSYLFHTCCISDSFLFLNFLRKQDFYFQNKVMASFNVVGFYINFSLKDSLQICNDVPYTGHLCLPIISFKNICSQNIVDRILFQLHHARSCRWCFSEQSLGRCVSQYFCWFSRKHICKFYVYLCYIDDIWSKISFIPCFLTVFKVVKWCENNLYGISLCWVRFYYVNQCYYIMFISPLIHLKMLRRSIIKTHFPSYPTSVHYGGESDCALPVLDVLVEGNKGLFSVYLPPNVCTSNDIPSSPSPI